MIKLKTFILAALISIQFAFAQSRDKVSQTIEWGSVNSNIKIHKILTVYVEGNFRFAKSFEPMQHQFRTGLDIALSKKFSILPGYVYTWNYKYGEQPAGAINNEHRLFLQGTFKNAWKRLYFQQRIRFEKRYIQAHSNTETSDAYSVDRNRLRYRSLVNIPFNKEKVEAGAIFASVWDEVFLSWGKDVTYNDAPDQNRVYAGLGYQISKPFNVQAGFIYQYMIKKNGLQQENNYGVMASLTYNFDLTKKEQK
jgi:hypothetical protein